MNQGPSLLTFVRVLPERVGHQRRIHPGDRVALGATLCSVLHPWLYGPQFDNHVMT
jgi:hypothetical protein